MTTSNGTLKLITLIALTFQNSSLILLSRYSLGILNEKYLKQSSILMSELLKLVCSLALGLYGFSKRSHMLPSQFSPTNAAKKGETGNSLETPTTVSQYITQLFRYAPIMAPVALIYFIQNYLQYYALNHLSAPVYSVVAQLKILTTAMFFVVLLRNRTIHAHQWRALLCLVIGVVMVQYAPQTVADDESVQESNWKGLLSGVTVATLSGLAGVYFEFVLKQSVTQKLFGVYERNFQLSVCSIVFSIISLYLEKDRVQEYGLLGGFSIVTWMCVAAMALGGLLVGAVIQYADAVLKNFASSCAITLTALVSIVAFDQHITWLNWCGIFLVIISVFLYSKKPQRPNANHNN